MSHMTLIEWRVHDLDMLKTIAEQHGCTHHTRGHARYWNNARQKADYTIEVPQSVHDIALNQTADGWEVSYDYYGNPGRITHAMCGELYADYNKQMAMQAALLDGLNVNVEEQGHLVRLTLTEQ
ncbi:hypothetical protein KKA69_05645 [Patescibacteria group bacterium]|nr:hypothetical protein [Patescibacteria group bacterium]